LIELIPEPVLLADTLGKIVNINKRAKETIGQECRLLIGNKFEDFLPTTFEANLSENMGKNPNDNNLSHYGVQLPIGKGEFGFFEIIDIPIKHEGQVLDLLVFHDITKRKEQQNNLQKDLFESEKRFQAITNAVKDAIILVDEKAKVTYWNPSAEKMFGFSQEEAIGKNIHELVVPKSLCKEGKERIAKSVKMFTKTGAGYYTIIKVEVVGCGKDGKEFPVELSISPIEFGGKWNAVGVAKDITKIKKMQGELSRYSEKLEELVEKRNEQLKQAQEKLVITERLAAIGELAGMVGHDLRNPLTGIKNSVYFLKKKGDEVPEIQYRQMLDTIDNCVDYSNKIVNDLLDYSRELQLEVQSFSPRNLMIESLSLVDVPEKIEIVNNLPNEPQLKVDGDKIKRVFVNLIKNAIESMPNVGKLTIDSRTSEGNLEISFADTGIGISDQVLARLFTPLLTTKAQGMGFGLAICKRNVEAHGGTIKVKTATGEGTIFTVILPLEPKVENGGEKIWINKLESSSLTMTKTSETQ